MPREGMEAIRPVRRPHEFDAATIGALAHLYRGEIYRSTIWRTRLDNTTNWAVVTLGIALSATFFEVGGLPAATPPCRRSFRCLLGFRGATLPLFQCLAGVSPLARAKFLRPYATRGRPQVRYSLDQGSRQRLLRAAPSYQLCSRHW